MVNKKFLILGFLLLFSCFAFAGTTINEIQHFTLTWNPNSNQLSVNVQCKSQSIGTLTLSNGMERTMICPTTDVGGTWFIGDQTEIQYLTGSFVIGSPCDVCSKTSTINLQDASTQTGFFNSSMIFGIVMIFVIIIFIVFIGWIRPEPPQTIGLY